MNMITVRQAAKQRQALDGADAQALEGALQQVERELTDEKAAHKRFEASMTAIGAVTRQFIQELMDDIKKLENEIAKVKELEDEIAKLKGVIK
jgi:uncharacterized protein YhaN